MPTSLETRLISRERKVMQVEMALPFELREV